MQFEIKIVEESKDPVIDKDDKNFDNEEPDDDIDNDEEFFDDDEDYWDDDMTDEDYDSDNTISSSVLPQTGENQIIILGLAIALSFTVILYLKIRSYKEIK